MTTYNALLLRVTIFDKWIPIRDGVYVDRGASNCALCSVYYTDFDCDDCPIYLRTGESFCRNTPYISWASHHNAKCRGLIPIRNSPDTLHQRPYATVCRYCKVLAQRMIYFLWDTYLIEAQRSFYGGLRSARNTTFKDHAIECSNEKCLPRASCP